MMTKVEQWRQFSQLVEEHINAYVVPQYGDFPDKMVDKFTPEKIQGKLEHYVERIGKTSRGEDDQLIDFIKMAHFQCYLYSLFINDEAGGEITL